MAYTKNISDADAYFGPTVHPLYKDWADFDTTERGAALAYAKLMLELQEGRSMEDPESGWTYGPRDDYAVFEQALYILKHLPRKQDGSVIDIMSTKDKGKKDSDPQDIGVGHTAQRWLSTNRVRMERG